MPDVWIPSKYDYIAHHSLLWHRLILTLFFPYQAADLQDSSNKSVTSRIIGQETLAIGRGNLCSVTEKLLLRVFDNGSVTAGEEC